ncbi:nucleotide sugar dehydrogenase [Candidatus Dependentiae bacterium]
MCFKPVLRDFRSVSVIGLGYIGLPTAVIAAKSDFRVYGQDISKERIEKINNSSSILLEEELNDFLKDVLKNGVFSVGKILEPADYFLICVPTPLKNGKVDLSAVFGAAENVSKVIRPGNVVILESTVPVGVTRILAKKIEQKSGLKVGKDFFVAHCPERVIPGAISKELVENHRVIGGFTRECARKACFFYKAFSKGDLHETDLETAEMVKLVENSCRDVQIAFANQVAQMCGEAKINTHRVIELANHHPRINILRPGPGVGGHCIAVDPQFLVNAFPEKTELIKSARRLNDDVPIRLCNQAETLCKSFFSKFERLPKVLVLGVTYKPDVDDLRESPSLKIAKNLSEKKSLCHVKVCEPNLETSVLEMHGLKVVVDFFMGIKCSDIVLILVPHKEFKILRKSALDGKKVIDPTGFLYRLGNFGSDFWEKKEHETSLCDKGEDKRKECIDTSSV